MKLYTTCVGTRRWSHSLWISKWTLNWTQCPRIPHSSHLGAKLRFELLLVRVTDPPADQVVKNVLLSLFSLSLSLDALYFLSFRSSRAPLHLPPTGLPAFKIFTSGPNQLWRAASCIGSKPKELLTAAQRTPHCSDKRSCQSEDLRNTKQVSTGLLSLQRKGATSFLLCRLSSNLAQHNSIVQHWNPNLLLQPPAPFLQRLVMLNWA